MARKKLTEDFSTEVSEEDIVKKAKEYIAYKAEEGTLKKTLTALNTALKEYLAGEKSPFIEVGDKQVVYSVTKQTSFNEELMIPWAKEQGIDIVKTKEYIDFDVLESLMYREQLTPEQLAELGKFKEVKLISKLNIRKAKKGGEEE